MTPTVLEINAKIVACHLNLILFRDIPRKITLDGGIVLETKDLRLHTTSFHSEFSEQTFLRVYTQNMSEPHFVDRIHKYIQTSNIETKILWSLGFVTVIFLICCGPILICYIFPTLCTCLKIFKLCGIQCCSNRIETQILKLQGKKNLQAMYKSRAGKSSSTINVEAPAASPPPSFHPSLRSF